MIEQSVVNRIVSALFINYDELKFNQLSWAYWYAVCAPLHTSAVHFGGLIEQLQRASKKAETRLVNPDLWKQIASDISQTINELEIDQDSKRTLHNKVSSMNQAPANLTLKRLLGTLGLVIGDAETEAWKHRNAAAHGGVGNHPAEVILNSKLLRIMFHRLLAAITSCSDGYIDYYNLNHPARPLGEAVPKRVP